MSTRAFVDSINGDIYCAPGVPFGDDDPGNVPADVSTARCEDHIARHVDQFLHCVRKCHFHAARRAFRGDAFDDDGCEQLCRLKTVSDFGCVPCLDMTAVDNIVTQSEQFADSSLASVYCASPGGAFLADGS
jgi:hypothetical protein